MSSWGPEIDDLFSHGEEVTFGQLLTLVEKKHKAEARASVISDAIQNKLQEANDSGGVETNVFRRISEKQARHNALVSKMSISVNGVDVNCHEQAKMKIPELFRLPSDIKPHISTAAVNHGGKQVKLECEWTV